MDSLVNAAARALENGDPLGALQRVALRQDPAALALRGIAMAQLGELTRARVLLRLAARSFGALEGVARARCVIAEAEIALAARDLSAPPRGLGAAMRTLAERGDVLNLLHARLTLARRALLVGRLQDAERELAQVSLRGGPPRLLALRELVAAEIALRRLQSEAALAALARAAEAATAARIPALSREIALTAQRASAPAARLLARHRVELVDLGAVERLRASALLVVDACRRSVTQSGRIVSLARRPILFELARVLAQAWPEEATRSVLLESVFGVRRHNDSHRVRLRVEVGRLRAELAPMAKISATAAGFRLEPRGGEALVLAPPIEGQDAAIVALLSDGAAWSTSALALALGASQRTVQRGLVALAGAGQVRAIGQGRARRWVAPSLGGFTTALLLPALPGSR